MFWYRLALYMAVKSLSDGRWRVQIDRSDMPRVRKLFDSEFKAKAFEEQYLADHAVKQHSDRRRLSELIELWWQLHGCTLSNGCVFRRVLDAMCRELGNPIAAELSPELLLRLRSSRLRTIKPKSWNNEQGLLKSVYNKLRRLKVISYDNPIADVDPLRLYEDQLAYLNSAEITRLLDEIKSRGKNPDTWWVAQICLRTGARWGEAEKLTSRQLYEGKATFVRTKTRKSRTVPLDPTFFAALKCHIIGKGTNERVFGNCAKAFEHAVKRAGIILPAGQLTHVCRHTFASHFVMRGGSILTLQKILGHADIKMTLRYAHLAPEYLADAIKYAPI
jgi:integrase